MKYLIFFLMLFISIESYSQVTGSTQTGKLIFDTENNITSPEIILLEPKLTQNSVFFSNENEVNIKGTISDNYGIRELTINDKPINTTSDNNFEVKFPLNESSNNFQIKVTNLKGRSSSIYFRVTNKLDKHGPTLLITEPVVSRGIKIIRKSDVIKVRGIASDVSGVLEVTVNNQKAVLQDNGQFSIDLYLQLGDNKIIAKAIDAKLNTTIDTFTVTRKLEDIITTGKFYALIIGINSYSGYWPKLNNAVNDARGVAEELQKNYLFNDIKLILDTDATRKNIIHQFEWFSKNLTKDDNLLIFYAGHGQYIKTLNKGYWVPVDAASNSVADYISNSDVKTFLGGIPAKHTFLITDACFAGDIFRGAPTESIQFDPNNMEKYYKEVYKKQSRLALTSGGLEEVSDAGKDNHSVFTYYLIKSLKENNNKYLDANQLFNDFRIAVTNNSEQTPMLQVVRDTDDEGGQFIFIKKDK